jgi:inhibitor of growth protein 3
MDYTEFLEDFLPSIDNIPSEIQHVMNELLAKDTELHSLLDNISKLDRSLSKLMRSGPNPAMKHSSVPGDPTDLAIAKEFAYEAVKPVPEQLAIYNEIETLYDTCRDLVSDKIHLSDRIKETLDRHLKKLCSELDR